MDILRTIAVTIIVYCASLALMRAVAGEVMFDVVLAMILSVGASQIT